MDNSAPAAIAVPSATLATMRQFTASWARRHSSVRLASCCAASNRHEKKANEVT